jgi:hypothetical protein
MVALLLSRRIDPKDIQVLSAEPLHDIGEILSPKSRLPWFTLFGAVLGAVAGYSLAAGTARLYPLNTGGMPIVSALPVGIVTYEAMMFMAVLFTLGGLLLEARLLRRRPAGYDDAISEGEIHVLTRALSDSEAAELLSRLTATEGKRNPL